MFYTTAYYLALSIFIIGFMVRIFRWWTTKIGRNSADFSVSKRAAGSIKSGAANFFSAGGIKTLFTDVLLQLPVLRNDFWRWLAHFNIFIGFLFLFLMHAMDDQITINLFPDYYSTLSPYLFLRNFFGFMVIFGVALAACRRILGRRFVNSTRKPDVIALILLTVMICSGFMLEAVKITSAPIFNEMVEEYADYLEPEEVEALSAYWREGFGVVFSGEPVPAGEDLLESGAEFHDDYCAQCHSRPTAAFGSYAGAKAISPIAASLNGVRADRILWYIHFLSCFFFLAWLPFSKFWHIFASSISLAARDAEKRGDLKPVNQVTRRAISLDACMNCGTCSLRCSVAPIHKVLGAPDILPSNKLGSIRMLIKKSAGETGDISKLNQGALICTKCNRCTEICPAGINLQDLWSAAGEDLEDQGFPTPYGQAADQRASIPIDADISTGYDFDRRLHPGEPLFTAAADSFSACIQCGTCTNVCPAVANYQDDPDAMGALDATPQQIVNAFRLGMTDLVLNSRMVWDCFMCFKCQEHCPKAIPAAEMIYELRNRSYKGLREGGK